MLKEQKKMEVKATDCQANYRELLKDKKRIVIKV